jgi:predicted SnoaL-like aldol condensation-catalyzing enzyme
MSEENNKTIVRRIWDEVWQEGNLATIDELIDPNHVLHAYPEDLDYGSGVEGFKRLVSTNRANLPDGQLTIEDLIAEDDRVVTRYTMRMPTAMTTGIWIDRVLDNKVIESWVDWDRLGLFQQLGIIPKLGQADS